MATDLKTLSYSELAHMLKDNFRVTANAVRELLPDETPFPDPREMSAYADTLSDEVFGEQLKREADDSAKQIQMMQVVTAVTIENLAILQAIAEKAQEEN